MTDNDLVQILNAGIQSVQPSRLFPQILSDPSHDLIQEWLGARERYLLCIGKAALSSAKAILKETQCTDVFLLTPAGAGPGALPAVKIHYGSHPVPDETSVRSTAQLLSWLDALPGGAQLLAVLSGGSSALLVSPSPGIPPEAKFRLNRLLLASGASIAEMNAVRKHCSDVKGGQLGLRASRLRTRVLVISDVIGNDLAAIGSGPFYADPTTFLEARRCLERYGAWEAAPEEIRRRLERGVAGDIAETPKPGALSIPHEIIASNDTARRAAAQAAASLGYAVRQIDEPVSGLVEEAAGRITSAILECPPGTALILGGEVTVRLQGSGTGGRNQHLTLWMTQHLAGRAVSFAATGTDGIDGNSTAAGAWTDGETAARAAAAGLDIADALSRFDSFPFFQQLHQNIVTGPTGTNVMDLYVALT